MTRSSLPFALLVSAATVVVVATANAAAVAAPHSKGFDKIVQPFFNKYCLQCHGEDVQEGGIALHKLSLDEFAKRDLETWSKVRQQLFIGEMPPEGESQPPSNLRAQISSWTRTQLIAAGRDPDAKFRLPANANYLKHEDLFAADPETPTASVPRLWRINPEAYDSFVRRTAGKNFRASPAFSIDNSGGGFGDYATLYKLDGPNTEQLLRNALAIAREQSFYTIYNDPKQGQRVRMGSLGEAARLLAPDAKKPTREQIEAVVQKQFEKVLLRRPTDDELKRFTDFGVSDVEKLGIRFGLRNLLAAILLQPEAVYRSETGAGEPDQHGRVRLTPREIAFALSYALTDQPPDHKLLSAAETEAFATREQVAAQVGRLLDDPKLERPRILRFFREYFNYPEAESVFKDRELFEQHKPETLVSDTDQLVRFILNEDQDVLVKLLTTNLSFVNYNRDSKGNATQARQERVHESYGLPVDWKWIPDQPVELPKTQRRGILTQPSWLVAHSDNFDNHVIRRGKWIRERLLGGTIPDLPITVDAQLPEDEHKTLRERMEVTKQDYCWKCHQRMNPLGFPFERYDHFGRYRLTEKEKPVDTSGRIDRTVPELTAEVDDPFQLIEQLAQSKHVRQVFVRHVFRYFLGRNETKDDGPALVAADRAYVESGGSFRALMISILSSDPFLYRWHAAERSPDNLKGPLK